MHEITGSIADEVLTIKISGKIDSGNAPEAEGKILALITDKHPEEIIIDAEDLQYITSAGLRVLLHVRLQNEKFRLINVNPEVYEILEMTGFSQMIEVKKAYSEISVEGCEVIGRCADGILYRIDRDRVVKVYKNADALKMIQHERECAGTALALGIPAAVSSDVVKVNGSYGSVFELPDAEPFSDIIVHQPERTVWCIKEFADMLIRIHSTKVPGGKLPDIKETALDWVSFLKDYLPSGPWEKLNRLVDSVPEDDHMIHGDYHFKNLVLQDDKVLIIDMDTLSVGHPVFELGSMYNAFIGFSEYNHDAVKNFTDIDFDSACDIWNKVLKEYLGTDDDRFVKDAEDKARIIGYTGLIRRSILGNGLDTAQGRAEIELWKQELIELLEKTDSLIFERNTIEIAAKTEKLGEVLEFLERHLHGVGCSMVIEQKLNIAVEEIFVNIASYAYQSITGTARINVRTRDNVLTITFSDEGAPFNPVEKEDPDINLPASERSVGGLGIFLVKKIMDSMEYKYQDGRNILTVKKELK